MSPNLAQEPVTRDDAAASQLPASSVEAAEVLARLEAAQREEFFCSLAKQNPSKAAQVIGLLGKQEALELLCEIALRGLESRAWKATDRQLRREIKKQLPELVQAARQFVYTISAGQWQGTENVSDITGQNGLSLSATRTIFRRVPPFRATRLTSRDGKPVSYVTGRGGEETVRATFDREKIRWRVQVLAGTRDRVIAADADVRVLDNFTWHHFSFLVGEYDEGRPGKQRFNLFIPSLGQQIVAEVWDAGRQPVEIAGVATLARCFQILLASKALVEVRTDETKTPFLIQEHQQHLQVVNEVVFARHLRRTL